MTKFQVDTQRLNSDGKKIMALANEYMRHYRAYVAAAEGTSAGWTGDDQVAFVRTVHTYDAQALKLYKQFLGAGKDLCQAAERLEQTENNNISRSGSLRSDF